MSFATCETKEKQELIKKLKAQTGAVILAHTYQSPEITEVADLVGDSFALASKCASLDAKRVIMCGVRFMAESVKILAPEKEVILPVPSATCPMAEMIPPERVRRFKEEHPDALVVAYINTTAAFKAECDVCVTSSSALKIVSKLDAPEILFVPDKNLGSYVQKMLPEKNITLWDGYCPVHNSLTAEDVIKAKAEHPDALVAVHPECVPEVVELADMAGSTAEIIKFARESSRPVIIGTERGVADGFLAREADKKDKYLYLCPEKLVCPDMKKITLDSVVAALNGKSGESVTVDEELRANAKKSIDEMLRLG